MEEQRKEEITEPQEATEGNVVALFGRQPARRAEPMPTNEELAEYRRIRPRLLQMLREWEMLKGPRGCPVARSILDAD